MSLYSLREGDYAIRDIGNTLPMLMIVREMKDKTVICDAVDNNGSIYHGGWEFDLNTGAEEDEDLCWGVKFKRTGSVLRHAYSFVNGRYSPHASKRAH